MNINYSLLSEATSSYKILGYEFVEVPWIVSENSSKIPNPPEDGVYRTREGLCLIGSAEQGFIEIMDSLEYNTKYATISPCFRKNDNRDEFHQETFMKLELFYKTKELNYMIHEIIEDARRVFKLLGIKKENLFVLASDENKDFVVIHDKGNLEIGSYGYRKINDDYIIYATGLALPRFQQALDIQIKYD